MQRERAVGVSSREALHEVVPELSAEKVVSRTVGLVIGCKSAGEIPNAGGTTDFCSPCFAVAKQGFCFAKYSTKEILYA